MPNIIRTKCIIAGDSTVGKTAISQVIQSGRTSFPKNYVMTRGVQLGSRSINIPDTNDIVEFYFYDSSGKDVYLDALLKYWEKPELAVLVFDVTNEKSMQSCEKWLNSIRSLVTNDTNFSGVLLANKIDEQDRRVITPKCGQDFAQKLGLQYFECSAKEMTSVEEPFYYLANECHKLFVEKCGKI